MLTEPLALNRIDATEIIDVLYEIFCRDFIESDTYLADQIYINPRSHRKDDDKEMDFWHLTTRDVKEKVWENRKPVWRVVDRYLDFDRASRLEWVKQILTHHDDESIRFFYHRETNRKKDIRLYLWAFEEDFVVILQKLGRSSSFLVTSFYLDHEGKKRDFNARYQNYLKTDPELFECEWF
ncbi:hypothetical protein [Thiomicrospira microaerophila]|uniref:hypothetical protein n=1 Tax=Thiomicrospira microaerophila TaxID=406020 RepID=UPI0005CAF6F3|nr:hypothetical protein [Thiomicrospira microaerophila]